MSGAIGAAHWLHLVDATAAARAAAAFGADPDSARVVGASENVVVRAAVGHETIFVRLSHPKHRDEAQLRAEIDFVSYLADRGLPVARPRPAPGGQHLVAVPLAGVDTHAAAFDEAPGREIPARPPPDAAHFRARGHFLGALHTAARAYRAPGPERLHWHEEHAWALASGILETEPPEVRREHDALRDALAALPTGRDQYGLVHGDFGASNLRLDGARLHVFDFDDCCRHWFVYDVAVTMYPHAARPDRRALLDALRAGYAATSGVGAPSPDAVGLFGRVRLLFLYLHRRARLAGRPPAAEEAAWFAARRATMRSPVAW
ncbi:MAG: phosphotransferase enzyme family protein [Gemmatimonadaceae bacterium]